MVIRLFDGYYYYITRKYHPVYILQDKCNLPEIVIHESIELVYLSVTLPRFFKICTENGIIVRVEIEFLIYFSVLSRD